MTHVQTVTAPATASAPVTIATAQPESASNKGVSPWAWVLFGAGIAAVALIVWTIDLQGADSAVLSRDGEHVRVTVDARGEVASNRLVPG